jgi:hypothetical protein
VACDIPNYRNDYLVDTEYYDPAKGVWIMILRVNNRLIVPIRKDGKRYNHPKLTAKMLPVKPRHTAELKKK